ncbi:MAG: magnetosome biogenesis CDF transporter MamM [Gammaproteobacteria bacterium SHHR-1]|nr:magnetosome biogenesis CDF transporter MamM [gamma proteobacterium SS-5]
MVGWIGLFTNLVLLILKGFVGIISGSQALVADAMYSAKDVVSSILVIIGLKVSNQPLDREHPYGHGKIEFILSMVISVVFLVVTAFLFVHAVQILMNGDEHRAPHMIALWTALISVSVNVVMYYYTRCVSIEVNSPMVRTLSHHHYADATSSVAVAIGIIGAHYLGMPWIDTMVALFEIVHLMYLGGDVFKEAYKGLMDRSAPEPVREKIDAVVRKVDGVHDVDELRTRLVGQEIWVDLIIQVDPGLSVEQATEISEAVIERLSARIPHIGSVQVKFTSHEIQHIDHGQGTNPEPGQDALPENAQ